MEVETESMHSNIPGIPRITINNLPPDVLLVIFRDAFDYVQTPTIRSSSSTEWDDIRLDPWRLPVRRLGDPNPAYPWPECIASVCPLWRATMSSISVFWTSVVIWIGRDPTPFSRIHEYLTYSRDHPLDMYILRRYDPLMDDPTEKAQVKTVMDMLLPHVKRWRSLCMKLLHSSSLPLPRVDLVGHAGQLETLKLDFLVDDLISSTEIAVPPVRTFDTPELHSLSMGGVHFREAYVKPFPALAIPHTLRHLSITDYNARNPRFSLFDLLACLKNRVSMGSLQLAHLHLDCSYAGWPLPVPASTPDLHWDTSVDFVGMSGAAIAEYGRLVSQPFVEFLTYTRCPTAVPLRAALLRAYHLRLDQIHDPAALASFLTSVPNDVWFGDVSFCCCDGLRPELLHALAEPIPDDFAAGPAFAGEWLCPRVTSLVIEECTRICSADVRRLVEERRKMHAATGFAEDEDPGWIVSSVQELYVSECCELAQEDKEWLDANVATVQWDDWEGGYNCRR